MKNYIVKIKDLEIPYYIKNYKKSKSIKVYFKDDKLTITKSPYIPIREAEKLIYRNEEKIYNEYKKIIKQKETRKTNWQNGQTILYKGILYTINVVYHNEDNVSVTIDQELKVFKISMSKKCVGQEEQYIKKVILELFKRNTQNILHERLPYWSKITNIKYTSVKVRDAKTKYGSCIPKTRALHFTSRLVMLKDEAIDAVIVHELCHILQPNHSKEFYKLVEEYISNYKELDRYLKECSKFIRI